MHIARIETRSLDETAPAVDLDQSAADVVFLSFTDSDLASLATAWEKAADRLPSLRLANLAFLKHPFSIDLHIEKVCAKARFVLVRLLGGMDYWRYGVDELAAMARARGVQLAIVPGDRCEDARLDAASTLDVADLRQLWGYFEEGGPDNLSACLQFIAQRLGASTPAPAPRPIAPFGLYESVRQKEARDGPHALIVFYRSILMASDTAPIDALAQALTARGVNVVCAYVTSLKDAEVQTPLARLLAQTSFDVILNATAFSARVDEGGGVLDVADAPVLQVVLAGSAQEQWAASTRGLGAADLAMHVVLPEIDGRILTRAISFKQETRRSEQLEFTRISHAPLDDRIAYVADLACAWARLRRKPARERTIACVLSDYPAKGGRVGYAVGLDTPRSVLAIGAALGEAGYDVETLPSEADLIRHLSPELSGGRSPSGGTSDVRLIVDANIGLPFAVMAGLVPAIHAAPPRKTSNAGHGLRAWMAGTSPAITAVGQNEDLGVGQSMLSVAEYERALAQLPNEFVQSVRSAWGESAADPAVRAGAFHFSFLRAGKLIVAVQPDRGHSATRKGEYHDASLAPRHVYVAFYLWLRHVARIDAMVHCGTHGTLEWLPGKSVALSASCAPEAVLGPIPVVYPFIVNNPGEAAQAKRRIGAVTIGHLTPPLIAAGAHGVAAELEGLFDEYAQAQSLDPRRARAIAELILERAGQTGLAEECAATGLDPEAALVRLDAWLCDLKDMRIGDGLHVFGRQPDVQSRGENLAILLEQSGADAAAIGDRLDSCAAAEMRGLLAALDGRFVAPGPAGAPARGRLDVLPTGRNLFSVDPRAVPTRTAWEIGRRTAEEVVARYAQDHGEWPRRIVLDLWGSATMRTGGDDIAQAFALLGVRPIWDHASNRVSGYEILPIAMVGRARVDVTLRISGLFRDVFPAQIGLLHQAIQDVAAQDESLQDNPLAAHAGAPLLRIFGAAPGRYGVGLARLLAEGEWAARDDLGAAYLNATSHAYDGNGEGQDARAAFRANVAGADAFIHVQDMLGQDVLDSDAFAEHEGGFAAAAELLGGTLDLYHADTTQPHKSVVRPFAEEIARVLRGRAINPRWIAGQMRHGHRGAAEIAETLDNLFAYAALTDAAPSRHFDLLFDATCGDDRVRAFLVAANPQAARGMAERFEEARRRGFWISRRNSSAEILEQMRGDAA
ncbi:cobaltochelatase subunit CobN [Methylocapsa sp. S129]|uniref:cobaltochelatase subunit CobN n=1 Tax=Methylocapsa sp. S129 TaxID=1641869 RepID=UPI00131E2257|nr:cobaltochelatase subunit CobN [Methylocapsa sp. S129]